MLWLLDIQSGQKSYQQKKSERKKERMQQPIHACNAISARTKQITMIQPVYQTRSDFDRFGIWLYEPPGELHIPRTFIDHSNRTTTWPVVRIFPQNHKIKNMNRKQARAWSVAQISRQDNTTQQCRHVSFPPSRSQITNKAIPPQTQPSDLKRGYFKKKTTS